MVHTWTMAKQKAPRGRPPERADGVARTRILGVRLTDEEESVILEAVPEGVPPSVWLRQLALAAARKATR